MRALKTIVVVMAILIVAGLALLAYGLVTRLSGSTEEPASRPTPADHSAFGDVETVLPPNGRVMGMAVDSGRAIIRVETPDGGQSLMVFDLDNGAALGVIRIKAAP
ncbi:MAG: hypothetical protein ACKVKG_12980 [Alphaproteobacteria bacterium]